MEHCKLLIFPDKPFEALAAMALANNLETANVGDATPLGGKDYFNHFDNPIKALWCSMGENVVMDINSESVSALPN